MAEITVTAVTWKNPTSSAEWWQSPNGGKEHVFESMTTRPRQCVDLTGKNTQGLLERRPGPRAVSSELKVYEPLPPSARRGTRHCSDMAVTREERVEKGWSWPSRDMPSPCYQSGQS
jgi:hypothetical protein